MKTSRKIILLGIVLTGIMCKTESVKPLPFERDKVIDVLVDMHYVSASVDVYYQDFQDSIRTVFEDQVFDIHGITREDYEDLVIALQSNIDEYKVIEEDVYKLLKQPPEKDGNEKPTLQEVIEEYKQEQ